MNNITHLIQTLLDDEGYDSLESALEESLFGMSCPGICVSCEATVYDIEPDSESGYCEACGENKVASIQQLAFCI